MPRKDKKLHSHLNSVRVKANRDRWFQDNGPCVECGSSERLELDHVDPSTKVTHRVFGWSVEKRSVELVKCQVLCNKCHLKKSIEYAIVEWRHGTIHGYEKRACRCSRCTAANSWRSRIKRGLERYGFVIRRIPRHLVVA